MFSGIKKSLGIVSVSQTAKYITVEGIETFVFLKDCYRVWQSNQVGNQMFSFISSGKLRFLHFFGLDFLYICEKLKDDPQTRSSRRMLNKIIIELKESTWLGDVDREVKSIVDLKDINHIVPFPLKPFQIEFTKHVGKLVPAYRLRGYMLDAGPGTGKAQPLSSKIRVPGGWKKMGEIEVGDEVIGRDGKPTKVTGVFPQGLKDIYTITFADHRQVRCCAEHLWEVNLGNRRPHLQTQVLTTAQIIEIMEKETDNGRVSVPLIEPEDGVHRQFVIEPYILGLLLGDGCMKENAICISTPDEFIVEYLKENLPDNLCLSPAGGVDYRISRKHDRLDTRNTYVEALRQMDLSGKRSYEKHIPIEYLEASKAQRLALLQGLLDSDGYVDKNSSVSYSTSSQQLSEDFEYLVRSLGGTAKTATRYPEYTYLGEKRIGRLSHNTTVRYKKPSELFRLPKKKERTNDNGQYCANLRLRIEKIEKTNRTAAQCIMVENPEHLYVTDNFVVTHNTVTQLVLARCLGAKKVIMIVPKNSVVDVWENTVKNILTKKESYWLSTSNEALTADKHYYICHFEQLQQMLEFVKANIGAFKDTYVGLDESHNFNRLASDRTGNYLELVGLPGIILNIWASGTPIQALGVECIPFMKAIDPLFIDEAEERFRKIYGRDAKRANDILRNRIGHLKFHVPKQDVVDIEVKTTVLNVKMPGGNEYTLEAIGEKMRKFITERDLFYTQHKKEFQRDYDEALLYFEDHGRPNKADYAAYKAAVALISKGFDPKLMKAEAALANGYERKVIIPALPNNMKEGFRKAKSVVKYVNLTIMGECLGTVLGGSRSKCHMEMVEHIDFGKLVDDARKKTMIFTSFVEVLQKAAKLIQQDGYETVEVYGATNKNLPAMIKSFYNDEDVNPLLATYPSLSTAVPVTIASRLILLNQPFRDAIRQQTIARAARLGQDGPVDVVDVLLDTGDQPNISTRSNDIMTWSAEMTASILGVNNVDLDSMQLEAKNEWYCDLTGLACEAAEVPMDVLFGPVQLSEENNKPLIDLPAYLYHSSAYKQTELMPGFNHSGELVKWDGVEDNTWLYAADRKDEAIMLGISSAIEKKWDLQRYKYNPKTKTLDIEVVDDVISKADIEKLTVWVYTLRPDAEDGWVENYNPVNGLKGEYKTQGTLTKAILRVEPVDIHEALRTYTINIKRVHGPSFESLGDLIGSIKKYFQGPSQKDIHGQTVPNDSYPIAEAGKVDSYLKQFFGNPSWVSKQQFNSEVSSAGIAQPLSFEGKFNPSTAFADIEKGIDSFNAQCATYDRVLKATSAQVDTVFDKYDAILTKELKGDADYDKVEEICAAANKEFANIGKKNPIHTLIGHKFSFMGGSQPSIVKSDNDYGVKVQNPKPVAVQVGDKIPALNAAQIAKAVAIVHHCLENAKLGKGQIYGGWLDFEDGGVWNLLNEFDESLYMDYAEQWYRQRVWDVLESEFPYYRKWYSDVIIALLHWMDRSVK